MIVEKKVVVVVVVIVVVGPLLSLYTGPLLSPLP